MTTGIEDLVAPGPFRAEHVNADRWDIIDARGSVFATVWGDYAHHDAPRIAASLTSARAVERAYETQVEALDDRVAEPERALEDAEDEARVHAENYDASVRERDALAEERDSLRDDLTDAREQIAELTAEVESLRGAA